MDDNILQALDTDTTAEVLELWTTLKDLQATVQQAGHLVSDAPATLQKLKNHDAQAAGQLSALFGVDDALQGASETLLGLTHYDATALGARVETVRAAIDDPQTLVAADIKALQPVVDAYGTFQKIQSNADFLNTFLAEKFQEWLNQETVFDLGGDGKIKLRFQSTPTTSPFNASANLTVEAIYEGGLGLTLTGVYLRFPPGQAGGLPTPVIDWSAATLNPYEPGAVAEALAEALNKIELPLGPVIENVTPQSAPGAPPALTLDVHFETIPGFDGLEFTAGLKIEANGRVTALPRGEITIPGVVPIGTTGFVFSGLKIRYRPAPDNLLGFGTKIVLAADVNGQGLAFAVDVTLPLKNPGQGIGFGGKCRLGGQVAGVIDNGRISGELIQATLKIPGGAGVLVPKQILDVTAHFLMDGAGLHCDGTMTMYEVFTGQLNALIGFDGNGYITGKGTASVATATVTATWKPGFHDVTVKANASVQVTVAGFQLVSASVDLECTQTDAGPRVRIRTNVLGLDIDVKIPPPGDLAAFIQNMSPNQVAELIRKVYEAAAGALAAADIFNRNSAIRKGLASLDIFNSNSEAGQVRQQIGAAFDRFGVQVGKALSVSRWKEALKPQHFTETGGTLDSIPIDIEGNKKYTLDFAEALAPLHVKETWSAGEGTLPETDERIESGVDIHFDQVVGSLVDVQPSGRHTNMVVFLIAGATYTRRGSRSRNDNVSLWGHLIVTNLFESFGSFAVISIPDFPDASLLSARRRVYHAVKGLLITKWPLINFANPDDPHIGQPGFDFAADANDPGVPWPPNPADFPPQPIQTGSSTDPGTQEDDLAMPLPLPEDHGVVSPDLEIQVRIKNKTNQTLRIKTVRFSNEDPVIFSEDFEPNTQLDVTYFGGSVRGFAAWDLDEGKLLAFKPIPIYQDTIIEVKSFTELTAGNVVHRYVLSGQPWQ